MDCWNLGDTQTLDSLGMAFNAQIKLTSAESIQSIKETAEAAELLEKTGIAYPYDPVLEQNVRIFLQVGAGVAAKKYGAHWQLTEDEGGKLSVALCQVVTHYLPDFGQLGPAGNLAVVAGSILGPRLLLTCMQPKHSPPTQPTQKQQEAVNATQPTSENQ